MSLFLLDTDILSLLQRCHPIVLQNVNAHPAGDVKISAISIQEQMKGFLPPVNRARDQQQLSLAYKLLVARLLPVWSRFSTVPFTVPAITRFEKIRSMRLNIGTMDLRIGAIALENGAMVVTRNKQDFGRIPGLTCVDWSV